MKKTAKPKKKRHGILIIFLVCIVCTGSQAQAVPGLDTIDVATIKFSHRLIDTALWYADGSHAIKPAQLPDLVFTHKLPKPFNISPDTVQNDLYLKFALRNSADTTIGVYFFPGFYFSEIKLYWLVKPGIIKQVPLLPKEHTGFKKIKLEPHQSTVVFAFLRCIKTSGVSLKPELIEEDYYTYFTNNKKAIGKDIITITLVFAGMMLMMIFYSIAVFFINGNIEFLYYAGYAFCIAAMLFIKEFVDSSPSDFVYFFEAYFDYIMMFTGFFIYIAFLRSFINSKSSFPFLHKVFLTQQLMIIVSISLFTYLYFDTDNFVALDNVENYSKGFMIACAILFIAYTIYKKQKLLYYLAVGHSFLVCGAFISLYMIVTHTRFSTQPNSMFNNALFYFDIGLTIELMFFMMALAAKNRQDIIQRTQESERLQLKYERQDFEKQLAVYAAKQDERNRISADMHDELGSGVTAIRLMSEIVKSKMKENTLPEINRISSSANDLINKMNTIIWTMKSEHDTLESLITYIRTYALEFFESTAIECFVNIPSHLSTIEISGEKRRNIFLSVKETLHNVLKHSKGEKVIISFEINGNLVITISDNGIGINFQKLRSFGNGLSNMKKRIESISGTYSITNNTDAGTSTILEIPL